MDVPHWVHQLGGRLLFEVGREMADIFIDGAWDDVEDTGA